jgi:ribosomal protein S18 acetylase RimI-like enzyme
MSTVDVRVRRASHHDFAAIADMMTGFVAQHHRWQPDQFRSTYLGFTAAIFQGWLERPDELHLAAEVDGTVSGYASASRWEGLGNDLIWPRRSVYVQFIVVAPGRRRSGIGRALFAAIEAWADEFTAENIGLNMSPLNEVGRAFYAALGYEVSNEYRTKTLRRIARLTAGPEPEPPGRSDH